jgi:hypothetical protein
VTNDGAAHVIARHTLSENGFEYWSYRGPEIERSQKVDYEALLDAHLDAMVDGLGLLFRQLARIENERRECMRQTPLTPIFRGISYATQCMVAAIVEEKYRTLFPANSDIVLSALGSFRAELVKRYDDDWAADVVDHVVEGTRMLRSIFPPADEKASSQFKIVADGVDLNMKRLIELASEIDAKEAQQIE